MVHVVGENENGRLLRSSSVHGLQRVNWSEERWTRLELKHAMAYLDAKGYFEFQQADTALHLHGTTH